MIGQIQEAFELNNSTFKAIVDGFKAEYNSGLETASATGLATMIPSFVTSLPTGNETGTYLSLDLGGSTLRISAVKLQGQGKVQVTEIKRHISPNDPLRTCHVDTFFDWMVDAISELIQKIGFTTQPDKPLSLGVCWSFPVDQTSLSGGRILRMGKGFTINGIEGSDLSTLFHKAFERKGIHVKVTALINDTVGTLVAHAYTNPKARVGFIYGTGVNAAYPEKVSRILKLKESQNYAKGTMMLVNTEIDIFGSDAYLPLNKYDRELDANHSQPNFQLYEKMMSGACLGELVRLACLDLIKENELFDGNKPQEFNVALEFGTSVTSDIEGRLSDPIETRLEQIKNIFHFDNNYTIVEKDVELLEQVCQLVSNRAARLAGAAMVSLIEQQEDLIHGSDPIVIGVNGSTYEKYPTMHDRIHESLASWLSPEVSQRIRIELATDGGSIGGALIAMLAEKPRKSHVTPSTNKAIHVPNNHPPPPSLMGCLFGWLGPLRTKKGDTLSGVVESIKEPEKI